MMGPFSRLCGIFAAIPDVADWSNLINPGHKIDDLRHFLLDRGMLYLYALFMAGYFLLPMASGHRRLYYSLLLPAVLVIASQLHRFYRNDRLAGLVLLYTAYMMSTLFWTADFAADQALWSLRNSLALTSFVFVSGYLWVEQAEKLDALLYPAIVLASLAAVLSIVAWYSSNPFPASRLEPLGVMHHQNKAACAYGVFLTLCLYFLFNGQYPTQRKWLIACAITMLALVLLTQSRTALAGVSASLLVLLGWRALGGILVAGLGSLALVAGNPEDWWYRVETFSFRPGIWQQLLTDLQGNWLFGRGYLLSPKVEAYGYTFDHAHNSYLASLRDGGIIGLILLISILTVAASRAWTMYRGGERIYLALLLYGMACISMDFDRLFVHPKELWVFFWLPIALIMASYHHSQQPLPARGGLVTP